MPAKVRYDWRVIRTEYIQSELSYRELAEKHGVNHASVSRRGAQEGWQADREAFKKALAEDSVTVLAKKRAAKVDLIADDFLDAVHVAIQRLALDSVDRWEQDPVSGERVFVRARAVNARDISILMEKMLVLMGKPGTITRDDSVTLTGDLAQLPPDLARQLLRASAGVGAGVDATQGSPIPRIEGARPVN